MTAGGVLKARGACASWMAAEPTLLLPLEVRTVLILLGRRTRFLFIFGVGPFTVSDEDGGARWP